MALEKERGAGRESGEVVLKGEGAGMEVRRDAGELEVLDDDLFRKNEGECRRIELIPARQDADLILDLISAQPLQEMTYLEKQGVVDVEMSVAVKDCPLTESNCSTDYGVSDMGEGHGRGKGAGEEFPVLSRDNLRRARGKEAVRGAGEKETPGEGKEIPGGGTLRTKRRQT